MFWFKEGDGFPTEKPERFCCPNGAEFGFDLRWIYGIWSLAKETEEDGAVSAMADTSEGERAVEINDDMRGVVEEICRIECSDEAQSGAHGADGVGA